MIRHEAQPIVRRSLQFYLDLWMTAAGRLICRLLVFRFKTSVSQKVRPNVPTAAAPRAVAHFLRPAIYNHCAEILHAVLTPARTFAVKLHLLSHSCDSNVSLHTTGTQNSQGCLCASCAYDGLFVDKPCGAQAIKPTRSLS